MNLIFLLSLHHSTVFQITLEGQLTTKPEFNWTIWFVRSPIYFKKCKIIRKYDGFQKIKLNIFKVKHILKALNRKWNSVSNKKWNIFLGEIMAYTYQHPKQEQTVLDPRKTVEILHQRTLKHFLLCNPEKWNPSSNHCNLKIFQGFFFEVCDNERHLCGYAAFNCE